jgi:hypothetical protein
MHMAGPREAIQHMIIRKNYGGGLEVGVGRGRMGFAGGWNGHRGVACRGSGPASSIATRELTASPRPLPPTPRPPGCTHFIVGRDMAGSKSCLSGEDFYGLYDAQVGGVSGRGLLNPCVR